MLQVVLCIIGQMVDFDVATHLQQLVQGLVRLTGVHVDQLGLIKINVRNWVGMSSFFKLAKSKTKQVNQKFHLEYRLINMGQIK